MGWICGPSGKTPLRRGGVVRLSMAIQSESFIGLPIKLVLVILVAALVVWVLVRGRRKNAGQAAGGQRRQTPGDGHYAKRCPTCRSIYADETLAFCLSDGSTLERVPAPAQRRDPNATLVYADAPRSNLAPTVQSNTEEPPAR